METKTKPLKSLPLFLPEGSVRAGLTIFITTFTCSMIGQGKAAELPEYWAPMFLGMLAGYGITRTIQSNKKK
jgi:hypothetical protein